jgi:hypothetical protein
MMAENPTWLCAITGVANTNFWCKWRFLTQKSLLNQKKRQQEESS